MEFAINWVAFIPSALTRTERYYDLVGGITCVTVTSLAVITGGVREPLGAVGIAGIVVWSIGILTEIVADRQKSNFRNDPGNEGKFTNVGLGIRGQVTPELRSSGFR